MRQTNEPEDRSPVLGPVVKPVAPAQPDPVKDFATKRHDLIGNESKAVQTIADALKKGGSPLPVISDGKDADWEGVCLPLILWRWTKVFEDHLCTRWADRWFFDGVSDEGYESREEAEDARAAKFGIRLIDGDEEA